MINCYTFGFVPVIFVLKKKVNNNCDMQVVM